MTDDERAAALERVQSEPWLSTREAAAYTGRSESTIGRAVRAGELDAGGTKGKRAFRRSALDTWLTGGVLLVATVLAALILVECIDLLLPEGDWGFPPGSGHPLEHPTAMADRR